MYESVLESKREREIEESKIKTFYFPPTNFKKRFQERVERTVMGGGGISSLLHVFTSRQTIISFAARGLHWLRL